MITQKKFLIRPILALGGVMLSLNATAHMPYLATDQDGHAVVWFGDSPANRTYHLPEKIAGIDLQNSDSSIGMLAVDEDSLVGLRSEKPILGDKEISGNVTYGLYRGTKLTYHVEHLPHDDPSQWSDAARDNDALQSVIRSDGDGIVVSVLRQSEPMVDATVQLFSEQGEKVAEKKTDSFGLVDFGSSQLGIGLNAVVVMHENADATGQYEGETFTGATDVLTSTFFFGGRADGVGQVDRIDQVGAAGGDGVLASDQTVSIEPSNLPDLPEELTSFGGIISDQNVYVYGGHTGTAHTYSNEEQSNRFWRLSLGDGQSQTDDSNQWESLPSGPNLQGLALVAHGGKIYRIGGFTAVNEFGESHDLRSQKLVSVFDPATNQWQDGPALPEPRSSLDAAVLDGTVYVFGGWNLQGDSDQSEWHQTAWSLDLDDETAKWQPIAEPPFRRRAVSVGAYDGKLFVIGGMTDQAEPTTRVDMYDPQSDSWTTGPSLPGSGMSGFGSSSFANDGRLFVSTLDGFLHRLALDQQSWQTLAKIEPARFFHRMLPSDDGEFLLIGGANMSIGKFTHIDQIRIEPTK